MSTKNNRSPPETSGRFIQGYTGYRSKHAEDELLEKKSKPILGYTGWYNGKVEGTIGTNSRELTARSEHPSLRSPLDKSQSLLKKVLLKTDKSEGGLNIETSENKSYSNNDENSTTSSQVSKTPTVGYAGWYRGKSSGKLGRVDVHRSPVSVLEQDQDLKSLSPITPTIGFTGWYRGKKEGKLGISDLHRSSISVWDDNAIRANYGQDVLEANIIKNDEGFQSFSPPKPSASTPYNTSPTSPENKLKTGSILNSIRSSVSNTNNTNNNNKTKHVQLNVLQEDATHRRPSQIIDDIRDKLLQNYKDLKTCRSKLKRVLLKEDKENTGLCSEDTIKLIISQMIGIQMTTLEFNVFCAEFRFEKSVNKEINYVKFLNEVAPKQF